jgi:large subunit ribosomal protein L10
MAKTKEQKQEMLKQYKEILKGSVGFLVVSQTGLTPVQVTEFKLKLGEISGGFNVVKNTIFSLALKEEGFPEMPTFEAGQNSVVYVSEDIAAAAKMLREFAKTNKDKVTVNAGFLDGQALTAEQAEAIADMPTREQSVAMIAGLLQQSMVGVVNVLEDSVRSIAIILDKAFAEQS